MKICRRCGKTKSKNEFNRDRTRDDGLNFYCRDCAKKKDRAHYRDYYSRRGREIKLLYSRKHRERLREKNRIYKAEHPEKFIELYARMKRRMESEIDYRLLRYTQSRMWAAVHQKYGAVKVMSLLGCSITFLRHHLEEQFKPGMTWENYGKWHIDHIIPTSWFPMEDVEWQNVAFHWSNLQPLWAAENIGKNNRSCRKEVA